ncbi:MAG TPA: c-type cytochrome [Chloroflexota bacterium]
MPATNPSRAASVELIALGAMAIGLLAAAVAVLLVDEPVFRRALGSAPVAAAASAAGTGRALTPAERGAALFQTVGCVGCHVGPGIRQGNAPEVGPSLVRLGEVAATRRPGMSAETYVAESIREPGAFVVPGFAGPVQMPRFGLADPDVDALVRFLLASAGETSPGDAPPGAAPSPGAAPPGQSSPLPRIVERRFDPAPPHAAYPTVWVGDDVTMVLRFAEGPQPVGEVLTQFTEEDGHGDLSVTVRAEQVAPFTWRASFVLPRVGRWEGRHRFAGGEDAARPFALRAIRVSGG